MEFYDLLTQKDVIYIILGIMIAHGVTKWTDSLEKNIIRPFIKNMKITEHSKTGNVISSLLELIIVFILAYVLYRFLNKRGRLPSQAPISTP